MKKPGIPEPDLDDFLKQTLKDDLPPETEARMNQSFFNLKRVIDRPAEVAAPGSRSRLGMFLLPHRRPWVRGSFRKEVLVFSSAVMLLLGVALHLGGYQSALAYSISRLKVVVAVSERLHRATSMDCTMLIRGAGGETSTCRVRWSANGVTRMDMALSAGAEQTLWISDGKVSMVGPANRLMRTMAITAMPQNSALHAVLEFLTPAILTRHMEERYGLKQAGVREDVRPGTFLLVGREDQDIVEIVVDENTYLPATLKKYSTASGRAGGEKAYLAEIRFTWNQPIPEELFTAGSPAGKQRTYH